MSNLDNKHIEFGGRLIIVAKLFANVTEDIARGVIGFIPKGLQFVYDEGLKRAPLLKRIFTYQPVEQVLKLVSGITIGLGLAADIAHFFFWPLGFIGGLICGIPFAKGYCSMPSYNDQISHALYKLSGPVMAGISIALLVALPFYGLIPFLKEQMGAIHFVLIASVGAVLGVIAGLIFSMAVNFMERNQHAIIQNNVQQAKQLSKQLKAYAKQKAKSKILSQAQDIIQQMNGPQSQTSLDNFFKEQYEIIANSTYQKIDRHFSYLEDRACHGDIKSLKRLQQLVAPIVNNTISLALEQMLERILNKRAIAKIKDEVDSIYDSWRYRYLKML